MDHHKEGKTVQFGNEGEELVPGKTENLSSISHSEGDAALLDAKLGKQPERGEPAQFDRRTGEVYGSGANAGGGGTDGEDYDDDLAGGGDGPAEAPQR